MAYMSQERKKHLAPKIKEICKKYGVKATLSVRNHSSLVLTIKSGKIDFLADTDRDYIQVNEYHLTTYHHGEALEFLTEVSAAMNIGNHDRSDSMTDYFDVGWYTRIDIGKWNKTYECTDKKPEFKYVVRDNKIGVFHGTHDVWCGDFPSKEIAENYVNTMLKGK